MWVSDIHMEILETLRFGRLDHFQVAATVAQPAFRVRAELKELKRERLVNERFAPDGHTWGLTRRGEELAWRHGQLRLP